MVQILKKNGSLQDFSPDKIKNAIRKAAIRVCIELTEKEEKKIVDSIRKALQYNTVPVPVNTIHNMVECALDNINPAIAKSYRSYRDNREAFATMLDKVYNKKLSLNFIGDRSNANADSALVTTQKAIVYNELNSELYKKFFLTNEEERAMSDGYIYIHDRGSRLDTFNCCLVDMKNILTGGFMMGNLNYIEPKSLDVAFDIIADVTMNAAACQYGGFTISEIDKLLAPYAEKSYWNYFNDFYNIKLGVKHIQCSENDKIWKTLDDEIVSPELMQKINEFHKAADEYATNKVRRDFEQGFQSWEMKFNSVASSRGDYPFTAITFGLGTGKFETMASSIAMKVRKNGQGTGKFKRPVLFPKINFFYDENMHGTGKEFEWLFDEAIDCASKAMYPDFISCTGDGYDGDIYKKYKIPISKMGCRSNLSPWYERGHLEPADENDKPIYVGRCNLGVISLHFPMIAAKSKQENRDFYETVDYYMDMARNIHKRTFEFLSHKKAGINPIMFCQGGLLNGNKDPDEELGEEFLKPMTLAFGITALNETSIFMTGKSIVEDNTFAINLLKHLDEYITKYKKEEGFLYNLYGTPAESLCGLQIEQFRKKYGIINGVSNRQYTSNSFHCGVWEDITPIEKQDIEYPMYHLCKGGRIQYVRYRCTYNFESMKTLVKRAMKLGFYEGLNFELDYCNKCAHNFIDSDTCPKCGSTDITRIERMNGYLGYSKINGKTMYADHKLKEFKDRISM